MYQSLSILAISWQHILIVALVLLLLFGGKKIPELMKGLGSGIKEFKDAVKEEDKKGENNNNSSTNN
ncbi:twin-arginine translocase TatA/TatE family subunit [Chryseobacterium sp. POL2]|uniref:twin-arginine translocase TatA/TatE family subunit n=1 Tax=Chryseobacterium sp. POL2 TaxID=2713414 RepID=UPI0013E1DBC4|nr:twin-arginine translocase TatA/TatE family subunit [Chryseobacterium sp. POL2]QIG89770.1 twin-arginine translocase TatA/TatE family subunit [Chryseobacterium sp. POL2]